jgi:hypothetical protein
MTTTDDADVLRAFSLIAKARADLDIAATILRGVES